MINYFVSVVYSVVVTKDNNILIAYLREVEEKINKALNYKNAYSISGSLVFVLCHIV